MPPTTGGSTSGSSTSERTSPWPRKLVRASTSAIGTPSSTHRTVPTSDVRRLSDSAVSADVGGDQLDEAAPLDPRDHRDEREQDERGAERGGDEDPGGEPDLPLPSSPRP